MAIPTFPHFSEKFGWTPWPYSTLPPPPPPPRLTFYIKLVSFKNIDIWPIYKPNFIKFGTHAQIWAYGFWFITQSFFVQSGWNFIYEFRGPLATSIAHKIWVLAILRGFCQIGTKYGRSWPVGTGGRSGSVTPPPPQSSVTGPSLLKSSRNQVSQNNTPCPMSPPPPPP